MPKPIKFVSEFGCNGGQATSINPLTAGEQKWFEEILERQISGDSWIVIETARRQFAVTQDYRNQVSVNDVKSSLERRLRAAKKYAETIIPRNEADRVVWARLHWMPAATEHRLLIEAMMGNDTPKRKLELGKAPPDRTYASCPSSGFLRQLGADFVEALAHLGWHFKRRLCDAASVAVQSCSV